MNKIKCYKCEGMGFLPHFAAYAGGQCFQCKGKGYKLLSDTQLKRAEAERERMDYNPMIEIEAEIEAEKETRLRPGNIITHRHPEITERYLVKKIEHGRIVCRNLENGKETLIGIFAEPDYKIIN